MSREEIVKAINKDLETEENNDIRTDLYRLLEIIKISKKSDYELQAKYFLTKTGTTLNIHHLMHGKYFPDDKEKRAIYQFVLKRGDEVYTSRFGQSIDGTKKGVMPTDYDILSCIEKYTYADFKDFCDNFGYDEDSRKAYKTYEAVKEQGEAVIKMFADCIYELREIN